jgi:hypothetical protein
MESSGYVRVTFDVRRRVRVGGDGFSDAICFRLGSDEVDRDRV